MYLGWQLLVIVMSHSGRSHLLLTVIWNGKQECSLAGKEIKSQNKNYKFGFRKKISETQYKT